VSKPRIINGYPEPVSQLGLPQTLRYTRHSGRTSVFYNDAYYMTIDECEFMAKYELTIRRFPDVPWSIQAALRCSEGMLYFFHNSTFCEFNEFSNTLITTSRKSIDLYIKCSTFTDILKQLENTFSMLSSITA
jgi:hypothetical protein